MARSTRSRLPRGGAWAERLPPAVRRLAAPAALAAIVLGGFAWAVSYSAHVHEFFVMTDELGYAKQALEIASHGRLLGPHDFYFTSYAQLLPLLSAPIFGTQSMADGYQISHWVYSFILASSGIPAYLLVRSLRAGRFAALLVAALTVLVPWLTVSGMVMTEVVAYPAFVWALLALQRAVAAPSPVRDVIAICGLALAFFARTQFAFLGAALVIAVIVHEVSLAVASERSARGVLTGLRAAVRRHLVLSAAVVVAAIVYFGFASATTVLGDYDTGVRGALFPAGWFASARAQLAPVVLAGGVIPCTLTLAWVLGTIGRPRDPARHAFAVLAAAIVPLILFVTGSFSVRFAYGVTDRYLFYLVPLFAAGLAMWLTDRRGGLVATAIATALVGWLMLKMALYPSPPTALSPSFNDHIVWTNKTARVASAIGIPSLRAATVIAIGATLVAALAFLARRRLTVRAALLAVGLPLVAYSAIVTGYTLNRLRVVAEVGKASYPSSQAWIDRSIPKGRLAAAYIGLDGDPHTSEAIWWDTNFWNKKLRFVVIQKGTNSDLGQRFFHYAQPDLGRGRIDGVEGYRYLAMPATDPRLRPRGRLLTTFAGLALYQLDPGAPLLWGTSGIADGGGVDPANGTPMARIYGEPGRAIERRVTLAVQAADPHAGCPCVLRPGGGLRPLRVPRSTTANPTPTVSEQRTVKIPAGGHVDLRLVPVRVRGGAPAQMMRIAQLDVQTP